MKRFKQWKNRASFLIIGLLLAAVPVGSLLFAGTAQAAPSTCTWTGSGDGVSWSDSSNWSGCGGAPQNGDSLVFDSSVVGSIGLDDDLNLQLDAITFTGTGSFPILLAGNSITLSGGVIDNSQSGSNIGMNITLAASQTFSSSATLDLSGATLIMGNYNLHAVGTGGGEVDFSTALSGTGTLSFDSDTFYNMINRNNPNLSGPVNINSGTLIINASNTNQLGTGPVIVSNGATLQESINSNGTYTIDNPITVSGTGANGVWGAGALLIRGFSATGTVNFTGPITLAGDTQIGLISANAGFSGAVSGCGYTISKTSGSNGTLSGTLTGSCTSSGTSGSSGSPNSSSSSDRAKAPSTGYGTPTGSSPIVMALVVGAIVSTSAGLTVLYRQKKITNSLGS